MSGPQRVVIPTRDPIAAAAIISRAVPSEQLDVLVQLLIGAPDLPAPDGVEVVS